LHYRNIPESPLRKKPEIEKAKTQLETLHNYYESSYKVILNNLYKINNYKINKMRDINANYDKMLLFINNQKNEKIKEIEDYCHNLFDKCNTVIEFLTNKLDLLKMIMDNNKELNYQHHNSKEELDFRLKIEKMLNEFSEDYLPQTVNRDSNYYINL